MEKVTGGYGQAVKWVWSRDRDRISLAVLQGIHGNMEDWEKVLRVHALVLQPQEEVKALVRYASISRKSGRQVSSLMLLMWCALQCQMNATILCRLFHRGHLLTSWG